MIKEVMNLENIRRVCRRLCKGGKGGGNAIIIV